MPASAARELRVVEYDNVSALRRPSALARDMGRDLLAARHLAWRLFVRDLHGETRRTILAHVWILVPPVATIAIWLFLQSQSIVAVGDVGTSYAAFVMTGLVLWQTFVDALRAPLRLVMASTQMLAKVTFPREALVLAGLYDVVFRLAVRGLVLLVAMLVIHATPAPTALLALPAVALLVALGVGLGLLLTPMGALFHDVAFGLGVVSQVWLYLTPVVYPSPASGAATAVNWLNPVSPLLVTARAALLGIAPASPGALTGASVLALVLLVLGWLLYRLAMPFVIERLGS